PGGDRRGHRRRPGNRQVAPALCDGQTACRISPMNSRDPLTPEERELARLLGGRLDKAPPPAVDAAVLAAARASVQSAPAGQDAGPMGADEAPTQAPRRQRRRARWPTMVGIAASVVFAVGLAWQMQPQREPPPAPPLQEMATPAPRPEADPPAPQ